MKDRTILISGANGQTGAYLAKHYLDRGARLILLYHKRKDRIKTLGDNPYVTVIAADLCDAEVLAQLLIPVIKDVVPDTLIHTASVRSSDAKALPDTDMLIWEDVFRTNVMGFYNICKLVLPLMQESGFGRVVVMGSNVTQSGLAKGSAYAAAKAAMVNMIKSLALENANKDIKLNAISPGPLQTVLEEDYQGEYLEFRKSYFKNYLENSKTGKLTPLSEIAQICDMLVSPNLQNLSGEEILVEGMIR